MFGPPDLFSAHSYRALSNLGGQVANSSRSRADCSCSWPRFCRISEAGCSCLYHPGWHHAYVGSCKVTENAAFPWQTRFFACDKLTHLTWWPIMLIQASHPPTLTLTFWYKSLVVKPYKKDSPNWLVVSTPLNKPSCRIACSSWCPLELACSGKWNLWESKSLNPQKKVSGYHLANKHRYWKSQILSNANIGTSFGHG